MSSDHFRLAGKLLSILFPYMLQRMVHGIRALGHRWTYRAVEHPKNIVVVGGSFAGVELSRQLLDLVPTGYRVVLIERNSHFHYVFAFPRFAVVPCYEQQAFIPYDGIFRAATAALPGSFELVRDSVVDVGDYGLVRLASGRTIEYAYLAVATGATQPVPARLKARSREDACEELRAWQGRIKAAGKVAVIGGGAVGVEVASDIKSYYPDKDVTIVQSRDQLLPQFGRRLHDHAAKALGELGVKVVLGQRPETRIAAAEKEDDGAQSRLTFSDGKVENFDLIIPCTGQRPNSDILRLIAPDAISEKTGQVLVKPTLQIATANVNLSHVFALGDVAETGGPKMGRASQFQAPVVANNIISIIKGRSATNVYKPRKDIEGAIKLTLGMKDLVLYTQDEDGSDIMLANKGGHEDAEVRKMWSILGVEFPKDAKNT